MEIIFAGDSWAIKGFTDQNYHYGNDDPMPDDQRMADHWVWPYQGYYRPGRGNLALMDHLIKHKIDPATPLIWIYTEPGRDYARVTGRPEFEWIESEDIFEIRKILDRQILTTIRNTLTNPIALIGGLSDVDANLAVSLGFYVLHDSWQRWIAQSLQSQWFQFGWGASDVGWRANYNDVTPSKAATFAWNEQIKEWCWWQDQGYFCHEHPTPKANSEFAEHLFPKVKQWLEFLN